MKSEKVINKSIIPCKRFILMALFLIVLFSPLTPEILAQNRGGKPAPRPVRPPSPSTGFEGLLQNPNNSSNKCVEGPIDLRFFTATSISYERDRNSNDKWLSKKEVSTNNTILNEETRDDACDTKRDGGIERSTGSHSPQWFDGVGEVGDACTAFGAGEPIPTDGFAKPRGYKCEKNTRRGEEEKDTSEDRGECKTDRRKNMSFTLHTNNKYYISSTYAAVNTNCVKQCVCAR